MVALPDAISVLVPSADFLTTVHLAETGITYWDTVALGPQPTQAQLDAVTQAQVDLARIDKFRTTAKTFINTSTTPNNKLARAIVSILLDEMNVLRQWLASFKTEVAAAASLADLKTRVATLPATPDRTLAQAKTAIANKIDGGTVD